MMTDELLCYRHDNCSASEALPKLVLWGAWENLDDGSRRSLRLVCRQSRDYTSQFIARAHLRLGQVSAAASLWPDLSTLVVSGEALEAITGSLLSSAFCRLMSLTWTGCSTSSPSQSRSGLKVLLVRSHRTLKAVDISSETVHGCSGLFESMSSLESLRLEDVSVDASLDEMVRMNRFLHSGS